MTHKLRLFQERGVEKIINQGKGRMLVWVPMGGGKTPIAANVAARLGCRRIVVLVKESGISVWTKKTTDPERLLARDWLEQFTGRKVVVYNTDKLSPEGRKRIWALQTPPDEVHIWVCIYNTFANDMGIENKALHKKRVQGKIVERKKPPLKIIPRFRCDLLIADECRRMSNRESAAAIAAEKFLYDNNVPYFIPMSGTPGDKGPKSFWEYWRLIDRKKFSSYWAYIDHFHITMPAAFGKGKEILDQRVDTKPEWDRLLEQRCFYVSEEELSWERPPLERQKVYAELLPDQRKLFDDIRQEMVSVGEGGSIVVAQNTMVKMLRLRQILICPKILGDEYSAGGAIKSFCDMIEDESDEEKHTVIFTPFVKAFPHFTEYLGKRGFKNVFHLSGQISTKQRDDRIESFRRTKGIIICSTEYAEAFSLEPARKCWHIGFAYSPDVNDQADKRLLRLTTKYSVISNYFTYGTPVDERMTDIIAIKQERIDFSKPEVIKELFHD